MTLNEHYGGDLTSATVESSTPVRYRQEDAALDIDSIFHCRLSP